MSSGTRFAAPSITIDHALDGSATRTLAEDALDGLTQR